MTAEIAILNKSGVALAADSAVTIGSSNGIGNQRVWKTTNKLFSLSPENDIAIMIFGSAEFCGVPWEIIIKLFAQQNETRFETIEECRAQFIEYIGNFRYHSDAEKCLRCQMQMNDLIKSAMGQQGNFQLKLDKRRAIKKTLENIIGVIENFPNNEYDEKSLSLQLFCDEYGDFIDEVINEYAETKITEEIRRLARKASFELFTRQWPSDLHTGIVFAGYGRQEFLPSLQSIAVDGNSIFGVRWWKLRNGTIKETDWQDASAFIVPYAQDDIAHLFIEGVEISYLEFLEKTVKAILNKKTDDIVSKYVKDKDEKIVESAIQKKLDDVAVTGLIDSFNDLRRKKIINPMLSVVRNLPKEEMANMAEALVEITSLRRMMDSDVESVAGPVDVALISKGDGLVWIKHKHYFDASINSEFFNRRKRRRAENG